MSANNWRICPQCNKSGNVPLRPTFPETMREDYEIWMDKEGFFEVTYSAHCTQCEFSFSFEHSDRAVLK